MFPLTYVSVVFPLLIIFTEGSVSMHNPFYCYSQDPIRPQIAMFGVQAPYEVIRGKSINKNASMCNPSKFWLLGRHGTRFPVLYEIESVLRNSERIYNEILTNYEQGRTSLCASDMQLLRNWTLNPNMTPEFAQQLTSSGWDEIEGIAQRYQVAFPTVLSSPYSPNDFFLRSIDSNRASRSLHAFADGLFGRNAHEQIEFLQPPVPDYFMNSYQNCPLYQEAVAVYEEQIAFREGPEFQEMTSQVNSKLGFHGSHALRINEIDMLFLLCKYDQIYNLEELSPFCGALSISNHEVHEYDNDLDTYYRHAYGYPNYRRLFENLSCFVFQDLLRYLESDDPSDYKAKIFMTHNTPFSLFLVVLAVSEDDVPLTRHNFAQQGNRLWRTGVNIPMAANIAVIRHDCVDGDHDVQFLHNEKPLQIAGSNGVCKLSLILERFGRFLNATCMDVFCTNA